MQTLKKIGIILFSMSLLIVTYLYFFEKESVQESNLPKFNKTVLIEGTFLNNDRETKCMIFLNTNNTGNISEDNRYSTGNWIITKKASDSLEIDFITSGWKCRIVLDNKFTATIYSNPTVNHFKWREL